MALRGFTAKDGAGLDSLPQRIERRRPEPNDISVRPLVTTHEICSRPRLRLLLDTRSHDMVRRRM
jgi:hypothetical protein